MVALIEIPAGPDVPRRFHVVVETPAGSRVRYAYDPEIHAIRRATMRGPEISYPADYGFIPSTLAMDMKPLDVLVLCSEPSFPGCVLDCRPIAVLNLMEAGRPDHKILAVHADDEAYRDVHDLDDLPEGMAEGLLRFFAEHPFLTGAEAEVLGWEGADNARDLVFRAWNGFLH